ncbi:MAG: SLBB domain-containing protein, partial [Nitrospirae bacterium]|nr:SLBB domain-containing protein [Nitrospirota bacterium]
TEELKTVVTRRMKEYIATPDVSVLISNINSYYFYILGEVVKPGKYPLQEKMTVLQAVSIAGGFTQFAYKNGIALFRIDPATFTQTKIRIRYDDIVSSDDTKKNLLIQSGDTILVP